MPHREQSFQLCARNLPFKIKPTICHILWAAAHACRGAGCQPSGPDRWRACGHPLPRGSTVFPLHTLGEPAAERRSLSRHSKNTPTPLQGRATVAAQSLPEHRARVCRQAAVYKGQAEGRPVDPLFRHFPLWLLRIFPCRALHPDRPRMGGGCYLSRSAPSRHFFQRCLVRSFVGRNDGQAVAMPPGE